MRYLHPPNSLIHQHLLILPMTTDSNNHISGSGNQQFQDCSIGRDLHIKTIIYKVSNNDQDENDEYYDNLSQLERLKKALDMTNTGRESFSTNKEKALRLFYKAQHCYPKLPEPYYWAGLIQMDYKEYRIAIDLFNKAKKYYQDVKSIYSEIDPGDLRKGESDLEERINSINDNVKGVDAIINNLEDFMKKHILWQKLFNTFNKL